ncbi:hypothetical protein LS482_05830 [Sinomicrobium kalidii]|uniref:hypothetical protein n=1 Tax=Sinomicrobium kalidii TaxID=2900738 RepID=UPI001E58CA34|nr:hypothetical protein [Sinomicrobium kalidii]UGU17389.1 hypothetical protein LS482_05830 [Sinomicrobium kalidii]
MKTKGTLLFGIAILSFTGLTAQPREVEHRKEMEEHYREMRKADEEYYREMAKAEAEYAREMRKEREEYYREQRKRDKKRRKHYAKHVKKGKGYPVYREDAYYVESPYRRGSRVAIDGEVYFGNGSVRIGYYD